MASVVRDCCYVTQFLNIFVALQVRCVWALVIYVHTHAHTHMHTRLYYVFGSISDCRMSFGQTFTYIHASCFHMQSACIIELCVNKSTFGTNSFIFFCFWIMEMCSKKFSCVLKSFKNWICYVMCNLQFLYSTGSFDIMHIYITYINVPMQQF